jgi:hypothetical protein
MKRRKEESSKLEKFENLPENVELEEEEELEPPEIESTFTLN